MSPQLRRQFPFPQAQEQSDREVVTTAGGRITARCEGKAGPHRRSPVLWRDRRRDVLLQLGSCADRDDPVNQAVPPNGEALFLSLLRRQHPAARLLLVVEPTTPRNDRDAAVFTAARVGHALLEQ